MKSTHPKKISIEICILAGGLGSRMGKDKARLRLGGQTLLARIRATAKTLNVPVRTIRRDLVPRCGPLGGVFTALKTTSVEAVLFLACDMPKVSGRLLEQLLERFDGERKEIFTWNKSVAGFPFIINRDALSVVEHQLTEKAFSLQRLAKRLSAEKFQPAPGSMSDLLNVNTPEDWENLKRLTKKN